MDERTRRMRRRRRNMRRIRQRNRRVALSVLLFLFIIWAAAMNVGKNREKRAEKASAKQNTEKEQGSKKDGDFEELVLADEEEKKEWYLKLVNAKNPITQKDVPRTVEIGYDGHQVDARIADDLQDMLDAARADGRDPIIRSSFRKWERQEELYQNKINRVMDEDGLDKEDAAIKAATVVAKPGTSEHQIGLALDIVSSQYTELDEAQMETQDQKWLMKNSWKYGFILRYPLDKSEITGVIFEPWHYRYVGKKAAKEITEQGLTLEEYLDEEAVGYPEI